MDWDDRGREGLVELKKVKPVHLACRNRKKLSPVRDCWFQVCNSNHYWQADQDLPSNMTFDVDAVTCRRCRSSSIFAVAHFAKHTKDVVELSRDA